MSGWMELRGWSEAWLGMCLWRVRLVAGVTVQVLKAREFKHCLDMSSRGCVDNEYTICHTSIVRNSGN